MKHFLIVVILMGIIFTGTSYGKIYITYEQNNEIITSVNKNTIFCASQDKYKIAEDKNINIESLVGKNVYIKYYKMLGEKYYVESKQKNLGPYILTDDTINIDSGAPK